MSKEDDFDIPDFGAVFTFGKSRFADNLPSHFFIRNDPIIEISCGDEHTAVVCQKGRVFVFGSNNWGQLGLGHRDTINKPSCVKSLKCEKVEHVGCGRAHTIFSTETNKLFAAGSNNEGQLGVSLADSVDHVQVPVLIAELPESIIALSCGSQHSAALTKPGKVYVWGSNTEGQCGLGQNITVVASPTQVVFNDSTIIHLSCGYYHSAFVDDKGRLLVCGEGESGKLGLGDDVINQSYPMLVEVDDHITYVSCGGSHSIALSEEGKAYVFGKNVNEQLGLQDLKTVMKPAPLMFDCNDKIKKVSCGERHSGFVTENGELWMCGDNRHGELCSEWIGDKSSSISKISIFSAFFVKDVICGGCHTMVFASPLTHDEESTTSDLMVESGKLSKQDNSKISQLPPLQRLPQNLIESDKNSQIEIKEEEKSTTDLSSPIGEDIINCEKIEKQNEYINRIENGLSNDETYIPLKSPQKGNWYSNDTGIEIDDENSFSADSPSKEKSEPKDLENLNEETISKMDKRLSNSEISVVTKKSGLSRLFSHLRSKTSPQIQSETITTPTVLEMENNCKQKLNKKIDNSKFKNNQTKSKACIIL